MGICCSSGGDTGMMTWFLYSASSCCCCSRSCCCCCCASGIGWWWPFPSRPFSSVAWDGGPLRLCLKSMAAPPVLLFGLRSNGFMMALGMSWMTRGGPASWPTGLPELGASRGVVQRPFGAAGETDKGYISSGRWWLLSGSWEKICRESSLVGRGWFVSGGDRRGVCWWGERERCRNSIVGGCWGSGSVPRGPRRTVSSHTTWDECEITTTTKLQNVMSQYSWTSWLQERIHFRNICSINLLNCSNNNKVIM